MMDERSRNEDSPQLLDLISNEREWNMIKGEGKCSVDRKLELKLGPPGGEDWCEDKMKNINNTSYFSNNGFQDQNLSTSDTSAKAILPSPWSSSTSYHHQHHHQGNNKASSFLVMGNNDASPKVVELQNGAAEKKVFSSPSSANTAVPNTSQKRNAPGPVVGWPPIRSFRKNLASSTTSKPQPESSMQQHDKVVGKKPLDNYGGGGGKGLFVKINMDGVPIGRKVDLNAYYSYENLSYAVDELFRGLLAAQRDSSGGGVDNKKEEEKAITGLLDGSGEYTLVYEDNEGDRMLVGDVPWHMFLSTVKRLRVLKSIDLSAFTIGSKQEKIPVDSAMK
ncbi:PREDICTED: auxin-responsive protein IAA26-like isoform X2 [Lupinus angustifolius]|uniref:auxin-responsive protein IAA26-like isoform X2 n=1 Tax=Lupinus angustifolius TaxID=3871 RepID=UPI00092E9491|nr:PREDICTED: auxin-responsive protein IAA26-like isoform X2 [Lupinus angustifolius]